MSTWYCRGKSVQAVRIIFIPMIVRATAAPLYKGKKQKERVEREGERGRRGKK